MAGRIGQLQWQHFAAVLALLLFTPASSWADCTSPDGVAGQLQFITPENRMRFCDGTRWISVDNTIITSCAGTPAGTIQYTSGRLRYCDGTNWRHMSSSTQYTTCAVGAGRFYYSLYDDFGYYWYCNGTRWLRVGCSGGGVRVNGQCWYTGSAGQSCTTICSGKGAYSTQTRDYAGSGGTNANCIAVLNQLGLGNWGQTIFSNSCSGFASTGCVYNSSTFRRYRCTGSSTTEGSSATNIRRACACSGSPGGL